MIDAPMNIDVRLRSMLNVSGGPRGLLIGEVLPEELHPVIPERVKATAQNAEVFRIFVLRACLGCIFLSLNSSLPGS
jgi:hypothetical protein